MLRERFVIHMDSPTAGGGSSRGEDRFPGNAVPYMTGTPTRESDISQQDSPQEMQASHHGTEVRTPRRSMLLYKRSAPTQNSI